MTNFNDTLTRMMKLPDGAGTCSTLVVYSTRAERSQTHSGQRLPSLVAGKAGGRLKPTSTAHGPLRRGNDRGTNGDNLSKVPYTLMTVLGRPRVPGEWGRPEFSTGIPRIADFLIARFNVARE